MTTQAAAARTRIVGNVLFSGVTEASNLLLFALGILAARYLGDSEFGRYSFAAAFVAIFQLLPDFGVSYACSIDIARDRSRTTHVVGDMLGTQLIMSVLTFLVIAALALTVPPQDQWIVHLSALTMILRTVKLTLRWLLKSHERFELEAISVVTMRLLLVGAGWYLLAAGYGLAGFVWVNLIVQAIETAITAVLVQKAIVPLMPRFPAAQAWSLLKRGFPFALMYSLVYLFFQINTVILAYARDDAEVGWFSAPYKIVEGLVFIPSTISYGLLPTFSALRLTDIPRLAGLYRRASKYLVMVALPMGVFVQLESDRLIRLVFGDGYARSARVFEVLVWSCLFMFLSHLGSTLMGCIDRQWAIIRIAGVVVVLNIVVNLYASPAYGATGAAAASLVTEAAFATAIAAYLWRIGLPLTPLRWLLGPLLSLVPFLGVTILTRQTHVLVQGTAACAVYGLSLLLTRSFDREELDAARGWIARLRGSR